MPLLRALDQHSEKGDDQWFQGIVWLTTIAVPEPPSRLGIASVQFAPGARTAWHSHPHGQVLLAVSGVGRMQKQGEDILTLLPGDTVSVGPGEKHWHGAAPDQVFVHIAMQEPDEAGYATWFEHVSDSDYNPQPR